MVSSVLLVTCEDFGQICCNFCAFVGKVGGKCVGRGWKSLNLATFIVQSKDVSGLIR